ncbi:class I SAM-dependent methyltransferase [Amycolatopsis tucumanensis]|uniref:Class I SAM-dependent methyltransferase n=2 Tax=Amycolatopsis tucumanensis TaxID=401106 RepID=A0ABP7IRA2_9PSEU
MPTSHQAREMAESFGIDAGRYDRARPPYPDALIERVVAASPGPVILDVGCGTGIEARQLRAAGCRVLGVDPDPRMAEFARRGGIEVEVATFEDWDPAGREFDAVVAGQAWHWVAPEAGAAKAAAVLRPGGPLAVFAHVFEPPPAVAEAFAEVFRRVVPDSPFAGQPAGDAVAAYRTGFERFAGTFRRTGAFAEPEHLRFDWERTYTRAEWLDLLPTTGGLTRLPAAAQREILTAVGAAIDDLGGAFTKTFTTLAVVAVRA